MNCPSCRRPVPSYALFCPACGHRLKHPPGRQRWVAVAFFDLSDFTRFTTLEGSERAFREVRQAAAIVTEAIRPYGGEVQNIAGDGFLAVFGLHPSRPDLVTRGLEGAAEALAKLKNAGLHLAARAAFTAGLVYRARVGDREQLLGDPINRASRILAATPPETLVLDARLAPLAPGAQLKPLDALSAKGVAEPIPLAAYTGLKLSEEATWNRPLLNALEARLRQTPSWVRLQGPPASGHIGMLRALQARSSMTWLPLPPLQPGLSMRHWLQQALSQHPKIRREVEAVLGKERLRRVLQDKAPTPLKEVFGALFEGLAAQASKQPLLLVIPEFSYAPLVLRALLRLLTRRPHLPVAVLTVERTPPGGHGLYPLPEAFVPLPFQPLYGEACGLEEVLRHLAHHRSKAAYAGALQPYLDRVGEVAASLLKLVARLPEGLEIEAVPALFKADSDTQIRNLVDGGLLRENGGRLYPALPAYARGAEALTSEEEAKQLATAYGRWLENHGRLRKAYHCYRTAGLKGAALRTGRQIYEKDPEHGLLEELRSLARALDQEDPLRLDEARALAKRDPARALQLIDGLEVPGALRLRGELLLTLGQTADAVQTLARYLEQRPEDADAWRLALPHLNRERLIHARTHLPNDPELRNLLSRTLEMRGALEAAAEELEAIFPSLPEAARYDAALRLSGLLWRLHRPAEGRIWAKRLFALANDEEERLLAQAMAGSLALDVGDLVEAAALLEPLGQALRTHPSTSAHWVRSAVIRLRYLMEVGRMPQAAEEGQVLLGRTAHPWLMANTALALALVGRRQPARALARAALSTKDTPHTEVFALIAMGVATCCTRRPDEERAYYRKALFLARQAQNPYGVYFAAAALGLFFLHKNPAKTEAIAHFLTHRTEEEGFRPFYQLGMLLRAQVRRDQGRGPIVHLLERFESPYPLLEQWRMRLLDAEGHRVVLQDLDELKGYGILGRMMKNVWGS